MLLYSQKAGQQGQLRARSLAMSAASAAHLFDKRPQQLRPVSSAFRGVAAAVL
jgi:hypothetical protein